MKGQALQLKDRQGNERTGKTMKEQAMQWQDRQCDERTGKAMKEQAMWWPKEERQMDKQMTTKTLHTEVKIKEDEPH